MQSRAAHVARGVLGAVFSIVAFVLIGPDGPLVGRLAVGLMGLFSSVMVFVHPTVGPVEWPLRLLRSVFVLGGVAAFALMAELAETSQHRLLAVMIAIVGVLLLYGALVRVPWATLTERMQEIRAGDETGTGDPIVPPAAWAWVVWKARTAVFGVTAGVFSVVFAPSAVADWLVYVVAATVAVLLGFGSPFEGSMNRVVTVHRAVFLTAGVGFLVAGVAPYLLPGSPGIAFSTAILGFVLLYHGFVRISWSRLRTLVELRRDGRLDRPPSLREWYSSSDQLPDDVEAADEQGAIPT